VIAVSGLVLVDSWRTPGALMQQRSCAQPFRALLTRQQSGRPLLCGGQMRHDCPVAAAPGGRNRIDCILQCIAVTGSWDTQLQSCQLDCAAHQVCTDLSVSLSRGVWFFARYVKLQCWTISTQQAQAESRLLFCLLWITLAEQWHGCNPVCTFASGVVLDVKEVANVANG
jgi:hypothetical protein